MLRMRESMLMACRRLSSLQCITSLVSTSAISWVTWLTVLQAPGIVATRSLDVAASSTQVFRSAHSLLGSSKPVLQHVWMASTASRDGGGCTSSAVSLITTLCISATKISNTFTALITIPVGILGYFMIPGTIDQPNKWILKDADVAIARKRLEKAGHKTNGKLKLSNFRSIVSKPQFWTVILVDVLFWNAGVHTSSGAFLLWIKSLGKYTKAHINELGTMAPALGIFYTLFACFMSDLLIGPAWAITMASSWNALGLLILTIWNVPESAKWFAFCTAYSANALSSVFYGWVNNLLKDSPEERSFTLVLINAISQSSTAWTPLLVFPTTQAPRYPRGFAFCLGCAIALIVASWALHWYLKIKAQSAPVAEIEGAHGEVAKVSDGGKALVGVVDVGSETPVSESGDEISGHDGKGK